MANSDITVKPNLQQSQLVKKPPSNPVEVGKANVAAQSANLKQTLEVQDAKREDAQREQAKELQEKVAQLNDHMQNLNRNLQFRVDEESGDTVVTVIDSETKELVRQIPSQEVLDVKHAIEKYRGILLEAKV
jgi:flagellar protein FlaG